MGKGHVLAEFEPLGSFQDVSRLCGSARAARQHLLVDAMCFVHDHINIMSQKALQDMALGRCDCLVASIVADARQLVTKCAAVFIFDGMPSPPGVKVAGEARHQRYMQVVCLYVCVCVALCEAGVFHRHKPQ